MRQAVQYAINKQRIRRSSTGLWVVAKIDSTGAVGLTAPSNYSYDPAKAKTLLAEAGFQLALRPPCGSCRSRPYLLEPDKVGAAILADLEAVGIARARFL